MALATGGTGLIALLASGPKPPSLVDCTSFVVARRLGVTQCLALDRRFAQEGLKSVC